MPALGEVKRANELGFVGSGKYIWYTCIDCGKERWVHLYKGYPQSIRCYSCANQLKRGKNHPNWKGGRRFDKGISYILVTIQPDDPFYCMASKCGEVLEHRYIMAKYLGRPLESWELVDHKNEIRTDNRIENLDLVTLHENLQLQKMRKVIKELQLRVNELEGKEKEGIKIGYSLGNLISPEGLVRMYKREVLDKAIAKL